MNIDVEQFYTRYGPMVLRRCRTILTNEDDALDATQEVFVRILENEKNLVDDAPSSLLYRMATNVCLNRIRHAGRRPQTTGGELVYQIAQLDQGDLAEARNLLDRIFRRQKTSTREIAALYWLEEMTYEEVARTTGMSVSGVRKRLRELRTSLERQGVEL